MGEARLTERLGMFAKHVSMATFVIFSTVVVVGLGARLAGI